MYLWMERTIEATEALYVQDTLKPTFCDEVSASRKACLPDNQEAVATTHSFHTL